MKINLQITDRKTGGKSEYEREEIAALTMNATVETIPAILEIVGAAIKAHLITKLHAVELGVNPKSSQDED
jgi:hypothetical protein